MQSVQRIIPISFVIGVLLGLNPILLSRAEADTCNPVAGDLVTVHSSNTDGRFLQYVRAIIQVESSGNAAAVNPSSGSMGLMQLTPIAVVDATNYCGLSKLRNLRNPATNIKLGTCYLEWIAETYHTRSWREILVAYNGGYNMLTRYRRHDTLHTETANYIIRVEDVVESCRTGGFEIELY